SSWRFHSLICVGCSSNSLQSSAMVLSSRSAASATLALNAALWERRVRRPDAFLFITSSFSPARIGPAQCTEPALSHLFRFAEPLLLVTASNTGNMPLMLTGTMELNPTVNERASLARRKVGRGSAVWHPLRRERLAQEPCSEFDIFMRALFKSQWLPTLVTYDDTWSKLFFEHTQ